MFPTPDQHPFTGANILCGRGYPDHMIRAIMGHATYTGVPRDTAMARALFATDELCGFLVACALVRPDKSLDGLEVSSVKKKLKDKAFARSVNRDDIRQGVEELGVDLDEHIRFVIDALRPLQKEIGLQSSAQS
jgi:predicted hydrolase (HD superfamily)